MSGDRVRVGVNLLWLRPGVVGGSEEYLIRQLLGLAELASGRAVAGGPAGATPSGPAGATPGGPDAAHPEGNAAPAGPAGAAHAHDLDLDVTIFGLPSLRVAHPELAAAFEVVDAPVTGDSRPRRVLAESGWLAGQVRRRGLDLVHHGGGTVPARTGGAPVVLTVHDLQVLAFPEFFSRVKRAYLRAALPRSVRRAAAVCVPSGFVAGTVRDAFGVPAELLTVVPHGLPPAVADPTPPAEVRRRYGLPERFVVYPAITHPHKDHVTLLRALARTDGLGAVLLGGRGRAEDEVAAEIDRLGLGHRVVRPGRISDADRDGCYRAAVALAFPSRYEGFGAPVLEAMALGCPVVAADATALPEVVGEGGLLVAPGDVDAWAEALALVVGDEALRDRLVASGHRRAAGFTAAHSARALRSAYRSVLR